MKELTIEEKAQRYNEALEKARQLCAYPTTKPFIGDLQDLFPELVESEDERIRKALIKYFTLSDDNADYQCCGVHYKDIVAWLEKQGGHEHVDKVEPKFKVGDWIVFNGLTLYVKEVVNGFYRTITKGGINNSYDWSIDNVARLWDITKDAKAGDVLICSGNIKNLNGIKYERICLFNNLDNAFFTLTKTSNYVEEYDIDVNIDYPDNTVPATKEQKEILFMAMTDAGYTFDFEKKELKKIEQKHTGKIEPNFDIKDQNNWEFVEKKPAKWSEEDDSKLKEVLYYIEYINKTNVTFQQRDLTYLINWLKSIRPQNVCSYNPYKAVVESIAEMCEKYENANMNSLRDFYSNIKVKCKDAKEYDSLFSSRWKPSEEQMDALDYYANSPCTYSDRQDDLRSLFNDLKKLTDE